MATSLTPTQTPARAIGTLAALWGLLGASFLLLRAILRLAPVAVEAVVDHGLNPWQWALATAWVAFMLFSEGYRGFQRGFSPRVVVRALHLRQHPRPLHVLLAPLYCIGLIHASRRRLIVSWTIVTMIVALVLTVHYLPQPYRGIVDAGVVAGLAWGLVALVAFAIRAFAGHPPRASADLP
jgi:hypothetical protein